MANPSTISQLLEEMENWDKDKRFMAASDLMHEITSNQALDLHLQKRVCQAFLKQLEDQSIDVQGNAVKCLAKIVCKFQDQQIGEVLAKLSQLVLDGKPEAGNVEGCHSFIGSLTILFCREQLAHLMQTEYYLQLSSSSVSVLHQDCLSPLSLPFLPAWDIRTGQVPSKSL